ncbi:MMPL family transporter [uncultured Agrococcus sp.]|uniref:MMPL family transporter n=1 Tax=uncultured Agrococcus sp. TaxID=382258 RepID=UPI0025E5F876|nr:MMPL family transporter [uncultured Agrococcus sp.]
MAGKSQSGRVPVWLRVLLPSLLIVGWLAVAGVGGPTFGKLSGVIVNDQASFLPTSSESAQVQDALDDFLGEDEIPAVLIAASDEELSEDALAAFDALASDVEALDRVQEVSPAIPSDDGRAVQIVAVLDSEGGSTETNPVIDELREMLQDALPADVNGAVTGPAGFTADIAQAFSGIDGLLLIVAIMAVLVILIIVYRSPLLPLIVLSTSVSALCGSVFVVYQLAAAEVFEISGQTQGILFILVIGAATDYSLLYTARYREALRERDTRWQATVAAWKRTWEPVVASGGTVIAGLICLLLSELASNRQLGPVATIGILVSMLAALTMLPALLLVFGRVAFWPMKLSHGSEERAKSGVWQRIAELVERRPRLIWIVSLLLLVGGAAGLMQLQANGVASSEFVVGQSEARDGQEMIGEHFPAGSGTPTYIVADETSWQDVAEEALDNGEVESVAITSDDSAAGTVPYPAPEQGPLAAAEPTVIESTVLLQVTLTEPADSIAAQDTVVELRDALADDDVLVGGESAVALDTNLASERDRALIIPIVLVVIALILMVLLRSVWAAVMLTVTTVVSFATALGVAAVAFRIIGIPDMDPSVPLYAFVFLVALGVDYNIFLMTRVREEVVRLGNRKGILEGLITTGGVITSAGVVLAATFAALGVIPVLFLVQLAIIVAFGVLLDTTLVRSLFVPALALELGPRLWWPTRVQR